MRVLPSLRNSYKGALQNKQWLAIFITEGLNSESFDTKLNALTGRSRNHSAMVVSTSWCLFQWLLDFRFHWYDNLLDSTHFNKLILFILDFNNTFVNIFSDAKALSNTSRAEHIEGRRTSKKVSRKKKNANGRRLSKALSFHLPLFYSI